jgi:hypothetical protein
LKSSLIRERGAEALEGLLAEELEYHLYSEHFADDLAKVLRINQAQDAQTLALKYARNKPDAVDKVNKALDRAKSNLRKSPR